MYVQDTEHDTSVQGMDVYFHCELSDAMYMHASPSSVLNPV